MRARRLIFGVFLLALSLGACADATGPRLPDDSEGGDKDPDKSAVIVEMPNP